MIAAAPPELLPTDTDEPPELLSEPTFLNNYVHNFIVQHTWEGTSKELYGCILILEEMFKRKLDFTITDNTIKYCMKSE